MPIKFLFDECVSDLAMKDIARSVALSFDGCEFKHIKDYQLLGIEDEIWVPEIAIEKCWVVISADRSKRKSKGEKLRIVCKRHGVTLVELSPTIHQYTTNQKSALIRFVWSDMMKLAEAPAGSRHLLRLKGNQSGLPILVQIDPPATQS